MEKLLATGKTDLLEKFISKKGRPFKAFLVAKAGNVEFEFEPREPKAPKQAGKAGETAEPAPKVDFTGQQSLGKCPLCGKRVFEGDAAYVCEQSQAGKKPCKFKINKVILQQPIDREQAARLLSKGKTDLLQEFISGKTGRPFSAFLVMDDMGKATFYFPPRDDEKKQASAKRCRPDLSYLSTTSGLRSSSSTWLRTGAPRPTRRRNYRQAMWEFHRWHQEERRQPPAWEQLQRDDFRAYLRFLGGTT